MAYVIRSMSTTDLPNPVPFHIYLMKPECRRGAWWTQFSGDVQKFSTWQEAYEYVEKIGKIPASDIVPENHHRFPNYWECRHRNHAWL